MSDFGESRELWVLGEQPGSLDADSVQRALEENQRDLDVLKANADAAESIDPWIVPTLSANWSVFGAPFAAAGYYRDRGRVFLKGMIKKLIAVVPGETLFTLPVGYRPPEQLLFVAMSNNAIARIDVMSTGVVALQAGNAAWVSLDHLSFRLA